MGCFESKEQESAAINNAALHEPVKQPVAQAVREEPVLNVTRPTVAYGEREKNQLKVMNMRDQLENKIRECERVMDKDDLLMLQMKREGNLASAKIIFQKKVRTKSRIEKSELMLNKTMQLIDGMEDALHQKEVVEAMERGSAAIADISKDLSLDRVNEALSNNREALQYTEDIRNSMMADNLNEREEEDFAGLMDELEAKYAGEQNEEIPVSMESAPAAHTASDVPMEMPQSPELAEVMPEEEEMRPLRQAVAL